MKELLTAIEEMLKNSANYLPLELSSFLGGLVEEVIAPIPSPFVMAAVGSAAFAQSKTFLALAWLALVGAAGKTIGAWVIYFIADKMEDVVIDKFGKFLGVSHEEVEGIGKKMKGNWKDLLVLFVLRALPVVPSSPVSAVCGIIKVKMRTYLIATFAGNFFRNLFYIYVGYSGISALESMMSGLDNMESFVQLGIFAILAACVIWIYWKRHQDSKK
jgi:membrane protein DedA with SNARE-associated domain